MGCSETKNNNTQPNLPILKMFFEPGNEAQKNYCLEIQRNFHHPKSIKYEIKCFAKSTFVIQFQEANGQIHDIQTIFNESEKDNTLNQIYHLLDISDANNNNNPIPAENPNPNPEENQNPNPNEIPNQNPNEYPNENPVENADPNQNNGPVY